MIIAQSLLGNQIRLGSLDPSRDFTYVTDTVQGFVKIAEADEALGEEINLGTGRTISIGDLVQAVSGLLGKGSVEIIEESARVRPQFSEVWMLQADYSKAKRLLDWEPRVSLPEGLKETIEWISRNLDLYHTDVSKISRGSGR
jgi:nucleoside-diphosphate-sugar epimerase